MVFGSTRGVVKLKFVKLSSSSCNKMDMERQEDERKHSVSQQQRDLSRSAIIENHKAKETLASAIWTLKS